MISPAAGTGEDSYLIAIEGMSCGHCVAAVEKAVSAVADVVSVEVDLEKQFARVGGGLPHKVIEAIVDAGYDAHPLPQIPADCPIPDPTIPPPVVEKQISGDYEIAIGDMTCSSCVAAVERAIRSVSGVSEASVNLVEKRAQVVGGDPGSVVNAIIDQGYSARVLERPRVSDSLQLSVPGLGETVPPEALEAVIRSLDVTAKVAIEGETLSVTTTMHPADLLIALHSAGYESKLLEQFVDPYVEQELEAQQEIRRSRRRALLAALVGGGLMAANLAGLLPALTVADGPIGLSGQAFWVLVAGVCLFVMWFSGRNYYRGAWKQARHFAANMDTLVALGTGAAWLSSVILIVRPDFIPGGGHLYLDASVLILAFLQFGHMLETGAKRTTSEAIGSLVGLAPKSAVVERELGKVEIPVSLLRLGDHIRVRPGERMPIDGEVIDGRSSVDESMLTGESMPVAKQPEDQVIGGTMNRSGTLLFRITRLGEETTLAHIITMVKRAQMSKPPIARLVDRVSAVFVPIVIVIAVLTAIVWSQIGPDPRTAYALTAGIAVLVIACPCALGLATPIAIMVGTGRAAQLNILIRNSDALQSASRLTHLVVDKTGTLTEGRPAVTAIHPTGTTPESEVIRLAAMVETGSEHPLAEAVVEAARSRGLDFAGVSDFQALEGRGVSGQAEGHRLLLGNHHLMEEQGIIIPPVLLKEASRHAANAATPVWLAVDSQIAGLLAVNDPVRPDSFAAVDALQREGVRVVMCTGDNRATAEAVAADLKIDEVHSERLPGEKLDVVKSLQQQGYRVGMVGDGINDAPALAQADTGFAVGSGADVAIDNADITLAGDSLADVSSAIAISSVTIRNIKQNLFGAFIYNVIGIPMAAGVLFPVTGWLLPPMFASAAMALSSVTVVVNANRLRFFQPLRMESSVSIKLNVTGMTCPHCVNHVTKALQGVGGVEGVEVTLDSGEAVITGSPAVDLLIAAVKDAGYSAETA